MTALYLLSPNIWRSSADWPAGDTYASRADPFLNVATAASLVHEHDLDLNEYSAEYVLTHYTVYDVDGRKFSFFPWPVAVFAVPTVLIVDGAAALGVGDSTIERIESGRSMPVQNVTASVLTAIGVVLAASSVRRFAQLGRWAEVAVACAIAFATPVWSIAARGLWQHTIAFVVIAAIVATLVRWQDGAPSVPGLAGVGGAFAVTFICRPAAVGLLLPLAVLVAVKARRRVAVLLGGSAAVAMPFLLMNQTTYGSMNPLYYSQGDKLGVHDDFGTALYSNLLGPSRGLLIFCPLAVLSVVGTVRSARGDPRFALPTACAVGAAVHLLLVSSFGKTWWAGHTYGPRFWVEAVPVLAILAVVGLRVLATAWPPRVVRALVATCALLGVFVHAQGAVVYDSWCWNALPEDVDSNPDRVLAWSDPQFTAGVRALADRPLGEALLGPCGA